MGDNHRLNLAFEKESIITQHGIFALLVGTLNSQIQIQYQSTQSSPFENHNVIMSIFLVALFVYATASVTEVILRACGSIYSPIVGNLRLFASALAAILLLAILTPILGCIISVLWACLLVIVAYESFQVLYGMMSETNYKLVDLFNKLIGQRRSRKEELNQARL